MEVWELRGDISRSSLSFSHNFIIWWWGLVSISINQVDIIWILRFIDPARKMRASPDCVPSPQVHKIIVVWRVGHVQIVPLLLPAALTDNQTSRSLNLDTQFLPYSGKRLRAEEFAAWENGLLRLCQVWTESKKVTSEPPTLPSDFLCWRGFRPSGTPSILDRESCLAFILARVSEGISQE